ncbi:MAG TPA: class I SAM-dependent methyltransferase, partial [Pirellulales bacterium]|nr:class I SAM-dependent methyltransferase [Pirellulales bacterium]
PFADGSFDAVTLLDVLEHVPHPAELVQEISRVLRPGGVWTVSVPYRGLVRWLSPENMASDHPRCFRVFNALTRVRFWVRGHNATGARHHHFAARELIELAAGEFVAERRVRRGSLLYAAAYLGLCFPPPLVGRAWASMCYAAMALDYQIAYGPLAYNLAMQFRKLPAAPAELAIEFDAPAPEQSQTRSARAA